MNIYKTPVSDLQKEGEIIIPPRRLWKTFFWLNVVLTPMIVLVLFMDITISIADYMSFATILFILPGLYGYAYSKRVFTRIVWKAGFYLYIAWTFFYEIINPHILGNMQLGMIVKFDIWMMVSFIFIGITALSFYLYGYHSDSLWDS